MVLGSEKCSFVMEIRLAVIACGSVAEKDIEVSHIPTDSYLIAIKYEVET